jgi:hypothetical protein
MQKIAQINFAKLVGLTILMIIIKEVIPDYLIHNPDLKSIYKIVFLGALTILSIIFVIFIYLKKGFLDINKIAMIGLLSFWVAYSWIQFFGIFR